MASARPVAIGLKTHTGWAAAVVLAGPPGAPEIVAKRRIDLAFTFDEGAVYHKGQELAPADAEDFVRSSEEKLVWLAREALQVLAVEVRAARGEPVRTVVVGGSGRRLPPLASILKSHPLVHAAEAELYRRVLLRASEASGIPARQVPAAQLASLAAAALGGSPAVLAARLAVLGKASGPPWTQDQREAAMAAWCGLGER